MSSPDPSPADDSQSSDDSRLSGLSQSVAELIDLERAKIGHDIHDLLLPLIFAASANLQSLLSGSSDESGLDPSSREKLTQSQQWLQEAMALGRNLLTQIYPPELDKLAWLAAAKDTTRRIAGDRCEVVWNVDPSSPVCASGWDRDTAGAAYRIVVEALLNAVNHGNADTVAVRCQPDRIEIVDDGDGFDPGNVDPNRFGIRSMKGRAALVGKQVRVESAPGGPTTVTMSL